MYGRGPHIKVQLIQSDRVRAFADRIFNCRRFIPILTTECHTIQIEFTDCEIVVSTKEKSNLLSSHTTPCIRTRRGLRLRKMVHLIMMFVEMNKNMCHLCAVFVVAATAYISCETHLFGPLSVFGIQIELDAVSSAALHVHSHDRARLIKTTTTKTLSI